MKPIAFEVEREQGADPSIIVKAKADENHDQMAINFGESDWWMSKDEMLSLRDAIDAALNAIKEDNQQ